MCMSACLHVCMTGHGNGWHISVATVENKEEVEFWKAGRGRGGGGDDDTRDTDGTDRQTENDRRRW